MDIGTRVQIRAMVRPEYINGKRIWVRHAYNITGWYVGYTYKQEGVISEYRDDSSDYCLHLTNIKTIKVFRIKLSQNSNDCFAFPDDVKAIE